MGARAIARVYVEEATRTRPRALEILERVPGAERVVCSRYTEIFNRRAQDFRLQKLRPSLILAEKHRGHVLAAPPGYGVGGDGHFYFSHMLNCVYDCRYCFLQGMYRSAHYVVFVNYEDYFSAIDRILAEVEGDEIWFFSGYDCDSLALDRLTGFTDAFLPFFAERQRAWLELRTKSVQVHGLLDREPIPNCVVAFSFTPESCHRQLETGVPSVKQRLSAMGRLAEHGWRLGVRLDPLLWSESFETDYAELIGSIDDAVGGDSLHSVSLGPFRLPPDFYRRMRRIMPQERLLAVALESDSGMVSYPPELERAMSAFVTAELERRWPSEVVFPCTLE